MKDAPQSEFIEFEDLSFEAFNDMAEAHGWSDGMPLYVPTEEALGPRGGGYETRLTSYSNLEIKAGTRIVEAGVRLMQAMTPGKVPAPEKVLPFRSGEGGIGPTEWSYGNVPSELS